MSRKRNDGRKISESNTKNKSVRTVAARMDHFCHRTVALLKTSMMLFMFLYLISGTLAMGIVYHQHKGHLFSWLAGDDAKFQKQAALEQRKAAEEEELEAECQASYHMSCTEYALSIAEATQSSSKRDAKQVAMMERAKSKARTM